MTCVPAPSKGAAAGGDGRDRARHPAHSATAVRGPVRLYYQAGETQIGRGDFVADLFVGQAQDFVDWEEGKRRHLRPGHAGVLPARRPRVLPDSYSVSDGRIRMTGQSAKMGRISADLRLNAGALATARRNLGPDQDAAMEGVVVAGGQTYSGVKFAWSMRRLTKKAAPEGRLKVVAS